MSAGSLCAGIGGADLALEALGFDIAWHAEIDPDASTVLAHHWPDVPNVGDIKAADWATVEPVDAIVAGYPCQPFSTAGRRGGADDPRHLWPAVRRAVAELRPRYVFLENVRGHLTLGFDAVLADLAALGFDAEWGVLGSAAVGACHRRERLWVVAVHPDGIRRPSGGRSTRSNGADGVKPSSVAVRSGANDERSVASDARGARRREVAGGAHGDEAPDAGRRTADDHVAGGAGPQRLRGAADVAADADQRGREGGTERDLGSATGLAAPQRDDADRRPVPAADLSLLPTPRVSAERTGRSAAVRRDSMSGPSLEQAVKIAAGQLPREFSSWDELPPSWQPSALLPTPTAWLGRRPSQGDGDPDRWNNPDRSRELADFVAAEYALDFGRYQAAVDRWAAIFGPPPAPTEPNTKGGRRLHAPFPEWMMGFPAGWVTDHVGRAAALRCIGNAIQPQTAVAAWGELLARHATRELVAS